MSLRRVAHENAMGMKGQDPGGPHGSAKRQFPGARQSGVLGLPNVPQDLLSVVPTSGEYLLVVVIAGATDNRSTDSLP